MHAQVWGVMLVHVSVLRACHRGSNIIPHDVCYFTKSNRPDR